MQLENTVRRLSEEDGNEFHNKTFGLRHTNLVHKHLRLLNESSSFPFTVTLDNVTEFTSKDKAKLFNRFFNSVISSEEIFELIDVGSNREAQQTKVNKSRTSFQEFLTDLDVTESNGPDGM